VQDAAPAAPSVANQVLQGAEAAASRPGQAVQIVLQPEGLGTVSLRVAVERAGGVGIQIRVDNPAAQELIQGSWTQLPQALAERGLTVQSLFLDNSGGQGGQNSQNGQSGSAFGTAFGNPFGSTSSGTFNGTFQQSTGQQAGGQSGRSPASDPGRGAESAPADEPRTAANGAPHRVDYRI
jgi:flagellar hook-length control protein FliK